MCVVRAELATFGGRSLFLLFPACNEAWRLPHRNRRLINADGTPTGALGIRVLRELNEQVALRDSEGAGSAHPENK
jgi:hypothetical protein